MSTMQMPKAAGPQLFTQGYTQSSGVQDAVIRNIQAIQQLSATLQSALGPNGRNKIIINHLQKMFLTSDAATIIRELEIVHPAAKIIVLNSQQQEQEAGDGTNLAIILAGELLAEAEPLLNIGLKPSEIAQGYQMAYDFCLKTLELLSVDEVSDISDKTQLTKAIQSAIASKQYGQEHTLAPLIAEAVLAVLPKNLSLFQVDSVRVVKIMGGSLADSRVVKGMVFPREPEGSIQNVNKAKVAIFSCPIDISSTETKGTVLLHSAKEMLDFTKGEEKQLDAAIKAIHDAGIRVVISGSAIGDLALHFLNRYNILALKVLSKFDLRRLCRVMGATPLARLGTPMPEEMGTIDTVETVEIGGDRVTVFRQKDEQTKTATVVLRGATQNHLDDLERAVDDGVSVIKAITKDKRLLPGAGATEMELLVQTLGYGERTSGLFQYSIKKYAEAFEIVPRALADNSGLDTTEVLSKLYVAHHSGDQNSGVDVEDTKDGTLDAAASGIFDVYAAKLNAIKMATDAALTILQVDQIIMARPAGGPKPKQNVNWDEQD